MQQRTDSKLTRAMPSAKRTPLGVDPAHLLLSALGLVWLNACFVSDPYRLSDASGGVTGTSGASGTSGTSGTSGNGGSGPNTTTSTRGNGGTDPNAASAGQNSGAAGTNAGTAEREPTSGGAPMSSTLVPHAGAAGASAHGELGSTGGSLAAGGVAGAAALPSGGTATTAGTSSRGGANAAAGWSSGGSSVLSGSITGGSNTGGSNTGGSNPGALAGAPASLAGGAAGSVTGGAPPSNAGAGAGTSVPATARSCQGLTSTCQGENCCTTIVMPGGTFPMGRSVTSGSDTYANGFSNELPEHDATVAAFALDKYEVTVGRFRKFVEDFNAWHVETDNPADNAGANPNVDQATATSDTGWGRSWDASQVDFPTSASKLTERLKCIEGDYTWTDSPGSTVEESYPINCVSWYEAFAFCVWDGGRLPTEAEWEYAAAGGTQNRRYPWGAVRPDFDRTNYLSLNLLGPKLAVGSKLATGGTGYFGHADQAGSMWEWTFDRHNDVFYGTASAPIACVNCANAFTNSPNGSPNYPDDSGSRTLRGGCWFCNETEIRAAQRTFYGPEWRYSGIGLRCARDVK